MRPVRSSSSEYLASICTALRGLELANNQRPAAVELHGYLNSAVGVGEAARRYLAALRAAQVQVLERDVPLPGRDVVARESEPAPDSSTALVAWTILCMNPEQMLPYLDGLDVSVQPGRSTIGIWSWEVDVLPQGWREASRRVDEIWTYSEFAARLIGAGVDVPVRSVPPPLSRPAANGERMYGLPEGFRFLVMFDYLSTPERKNPAGAIEAFQRAFRPEDEAKLIVKSVNAQHRPERHREIVASCQGREDIVLIDRTVSAGQRDALVAACDCYMSLHRSEGHGLPIAEAMRAGKPVVATAYGGNTEFMDERNSYPIRWRPSKVGPGVEHYPSDATWAEPDLEHAAQALRAVFDDRQEATRRASLGRHEVSSQLAPQVVGRQMVAHMELLRQAYGNGRQRRGKRLFSPPWRMARGS